MSASTTQNSPAKIAAQPYSDSGPNVHTGT